MDIGKIFKPTVNIEKIDSVDELTHLKTELRFKDSQIKELQNIKVF